MPDVIRLLPDSVANQIAAGEVIQRPASAVKELMENAVDAGADNISFVVKDAGKTLIQVVDNGSGMSETDARLSFERHATSKINQAKDLFSIHTMGFRGEALASICAIAHLEMKTKRAEDEVGTHIINEGSVVKSQEVCQCETGTSIAVKNLFFNVPARRQFLKSNQVELRHITDEFLRLAIAHPHISFNFYHNNSLLYQLFKETTKKRIVSCFGDNYNKRLLPFEHHADFVSFSGFITKPEFAKKTRGEQFFFTNKRFMKHNYLNHAVFSAFKDLINPDAFPSFFIFIDIDPEQIDINIHPTKTEIKFQDERVMYSFLNAAVKKTLGIHNILPSLDFSKEKDFDVTPASPGTPIKPPTIKINPNYNPFDSKPKESNKKTQLPSSPKRNWQMLYEEIRHKADDQENSDDLFKPVEGQKTISADFDKNLEALDESAPKFMQLQGRYILTQIKSGLLLVDQQAAHERILYEKFLHNLNSAKTVSQQELFPQTIELSPADTELTNELINEIKNLGFDILQESKNTFVVNGTPPELKNENIQYVFEKMLEAYKSNMMTVKLDKKENIAASLARNLAVKKGENLHYSQMVEIVDKLFACQVPYKTPSGKNTLTMLSSDEIEIKLKKTSHYEF